MNDFVLHTPSAIWCNYLEAIKKGDSSTEGRQIAPFAVAHGNLDTILADTVCHLGLLAY